MERSRRRPQYPRPARGDRVLSLLAATSFESLSRMRISTLAMVHGYWLIGREIAEVEQHGAEPLSPGRTTSCSPLAGFQVSIIGRFWVSTEGNLGQRRAGPHGEGRPIPNSLPN